MFRPGTTSKNKEYNVVSNYAGLGDHIARLPAIKWVTETYPYVKLNVFWHDYMVDLARFVLPDNAQVTHWPISRMDMADQTFPLIDFNPNRICPWALDLTYHAFLILADRLPPTMDDSRLLLAPEGPLSRTFIEQLQRPEYVVITPEFTSATRQMPEWTLNELVDWLDENDIDPVLLGSKNDMDAGNGRTIQVETQKVRGLRADKVIDMRGKTTLIQALGIIQGAKAIVGVDGGLLYLAGMTSTPRIRGMTTVIPEHRLAYGHGPLVDVLPDKDLPCQGCQSKIYFAEHDFRQCLYGDFTCVKQMTSAKFIQALKEVLNV